MKYTTETGNYVLRDSDGQTIAVCAHHSTGSVNVHPNTDVGKSFDVESADQLSEYSRHENYTSDP